MGSFANALTSYEIREITENETGQNAMIGFQELLQGDKISLCLHISLGKCQTKQIVLDYQARAYEI